MTAQALYGKNVGWGEDLEVDTFFLEENIHVDNHRFPFATWTSGQAYGGHMDKWTEILG